MRDTTFSSKAYGTHEYKDLTIEGRLQFDVYMALQRDHKLSSYTLNAVSGLHTTVKCARVLDKGWGRGS
jgi:DNA polymerase delta subunit 1